MSHTMEDPIQEQLPSLADAAADERAAIVADAAYWQMLCPMLHVGCSALRQRLASAIINPDP